MTKSLTLGNGSLLVGLDEYGSVQDLYYPHVGLENHVGEHAMHRIGVFVDGGLTWLTDKAWEVSVHAADDTFAGFITATSRTHELVIEIRDVVYNERPVYIREISITNTSPRPREITLFCAQSFELYQSHVAHTAYFDPTHHAIIHYRNERAFLINLRAGDVRFDEYTTGVWGIEGKEGSHKDAEDGVLSKNPIEHGPADSVVGVHMMLNPGKSQTAHYWLCAGTRVEDILTLNAYVFERGPAYLMQTAGNFWRAWAGRHQHEFADVPLPLSTLFTKSLFYIRAHADHDGAIIASTDADMLQHGKDSYNYMWPRDGARIAQALSYAGAHNTARRFFSFCHDVITPDGYFLHKYGPDKTLGSSWEPWVRGNESILPIQEDETALVVIALWEYYKTTQDIEFIEDVYNKVIRNAAEFMVVFRDEKTKLPKPSFDLWEEKFGTHTFTAASVYGALKAAAACAKLLGKYWAQKRYERAAKEIQAGIMRYLYNEHTGLFYKMITTHEVDETVDASSVFGVHTFGVLPVDDERLVRAYAETKKRLLVNTDIGGYARYENDNYMRVAGDTPGNPWVITTLWCAQYDLARAQTQEDLNSVEKTLSWVEKRALPSGVLPEQCDPYTGAPLSAAPLSWSHAEYVITLIHYVRLNKALEAQ